MGNLLTKAWVKALLVVALGAIFWALWPASGTDSGSEPLVTSLDSVDTPGAAEVDASESAGLASKQSASAAITPEVAEVGEGSTGGTQSDTSVIILWALAGLTTVLLLAFLFHTSPRRRARNHQDAAGDVVSDV